MNSGTMRQRIEYDRRKHLLHQWQVQLADAGRKVRECPQVVETLLTQVSTDNLRDLLEYGIKGLHAELHQEQLEKDKHPVRRDMYEDMQ